MLEAKLKEVRDKKQKRSDTQENGIINGETNKCGVLPANVDLKLQASGIIAVGETDVHLKFKDSGSSNLNLNASGISNVGKTNLKLGIGDGTVNIPGLENLFLGSTFVRGPCENRNATGSKQESPPVLPPNTDIPNEDNDTTYRKNIKTTNITNSTSTNKPLLLEAMQSNDTQNVVAPNAVNVQNVIPAA